MPEACAPCPGGFAPNTSRQQQIQALWRTAAQRWSEPPALDLGCLCFGREPSTSVEGQTINLPFDWELREQAARAAHLALHRRQPPWDDADPTPCPARVERALSAEADAHALELETRRALEVVTTRYAFEADYFALPKADRRRWLRDYFLAHPHGDGVIPGFASQYRARCR